MIKYLKKYWVYCLLAPLFMLGELAMDLLQPELMATIVDDGVLNSNISVIYKIGIQMIILVAFGGLCGILCGIFACIAAQNFGNDVRKDMFARISNLSFEQTDKFTTGSLVTRITNDVTQVQNMVMMAIRALVRCLIMFVGGIFMLYKQAPEFAWVAACGLPFIAFFVIFFLRKVSPLFSTIQKRLDKLNCIMQENIAGARVVKAYVKEKDSLNCFKAANNDLCDINLKAQTTLAYLHPCVNIVLNICVAGVLYIGGFKVNHNASVSPGQIMAAITYMSLILMRIIFMANIFQTFTRASASWKRIKEVLNTTPLHLDGDSIPSPETEGEIEFRNVSFTYPDSIGNPVLSDISFKVGHGETVAIIGSTGSGKSTLANLIPRFYDVTDGCVLVDGLDVRKYPLKLLRNKISIVQQKVELFSRSISENIQWGKENSSEDEIKKAVSIAQATDFIENAPDKYDTLVSESGHSLSGGQKQRLSIARAILKKPEILIFDDSGSALDLKTESNLYKSLNSEFKDTTMIIIAQRIASVQYADRIYVIDNGRISASGTHDVLIKTSDIYRDICRSQLKKEAMA